MILKTFIHNKKKTPTFLSNYILSKVKESLNFTKKLHIFYSIKRILNKHQQIIVL